MSLETCSPRDGIRTFQDFLALFITIDVHSALLAMPAAERSLFFSYLVAGHIIKLEGRAFLFHYTFKDVPAGRHLKEGTKAGKGKSFAVEEPTYPLYLFKLKIAKYPVIGCRMTFGFYKSPFFIIPDRFLRKPHL